ncbi:hypothetical protein B9G53_17390 [Pseudanabaena sp. SR411]|uniref:hypothetical protein n=1 Tax=Pseudanabaena sp. SR411 TaxID=1980935 RepID=UPI000B98266C|nr:hypothetical protein [Pseudanabaena sp. SR411]OYQ63348.1 hypothetical protein B9G53_17390 [Pseudanabaena sp. SR411]
MPIFNSNSSVNEELFNKVIKSINRFCTKAVKTGNTKMVLTEADLQAWIFHHLLYDLRKESGWGDKTNSKQIGIHCNPSLLGEAYLLTKVPDIIILDKQTYDVNPSGSLYSRKGYTLWGSSIIILELKLFRTNHSESQKIIEWKKDINKLKDLRMQHYPPDSPNKFFPTFVLLGKQNISVETVDQIKQYSIDNEVEPLLFYPEDERRQEEHLIMP